MKAIWERIKGEPALVAGVIRHLLLVLVLFGFALSDEQTAGILLLVGSLLDLFVRQSVTPVKP